MAADPTAETPLPPRWGAGTPTAIRRKALAWFADHQRLLPWRQSRDAYAIWVSEVMLQQTTVAAVVPFFERFLLAFPTVRHLAAADEQEVLKLWQGLGYYRRARHLHAAARWIVEHRDGVLPDDPAVWSELPGVGRYILGAVLSQAFDRRMPIVEANTVRVYSRLARHAGDPRTGAGMRWVWAFAERILPLRRVGDFNQAMMELGALICTPTTPQCPACPLRKECVAFAEGLQETIPPRAKKPDKVIVREVALVFRREGDILICQRPDSARRWPMMWEMPHGEVNDGEDESDVALRIAAGLGFAVEQPVELMTIRHTVTRFEITMTVYEVTVVSGEFASEFYHAGVWEPPSGLTRYPTSAPQSKLIDALGRGGVAEEALLG